MDTTQPATSPASASSPRISKIFCEGYGDFALESSDKVVFYTSRFLLAYTPPVFCHMFNLAPPSKPSDPSEGVESETPYSIQPIQVTEDALTLDLLLRHVDPKQVPAPISERDIAKLLEGARKYQLGNIMLWFE